MLILNAYRNILGSTHAPSPEEGLPVSLFRGPLTPFPGSIDI